MSFRRSVMCALCLCVLSTTAIAQTRGRNPLDVKGHVLDQLFPLDVTSKPYHVKLVLRFGDSDTQLIVLDYPGGESELVKQTLKSVSGEGLSQLISKLIAANPNLEDREIAAKIKVTTTRQPIEYKALSHALDELKAIRISPFLRTRVVCDEVSNYDFWFDTGEESVHYALYGPFRGDPQDLIVQWMIKFRARFSQ